MKTEDLIKKYVQKIFGAEVEFDFSRTDEKFGDYATNVAMILAGKTKKSVELSQKIAEKFGENFAKNPRNFAEKIAEKLRESGEFSSVEIAGPGFLNLRVSAKKLAQNLDEGFAKKEFFHPKNYENQVVVTEFSDPNPFKVLHIGHLYTSIVGDAISNLVANAGGEVHRVNFGGDVGLHVAKNLWAIREKLRAEFHEELNENSAEKLAKFVGENLDARANFMAKCYVAGTNAYEENPAAKTEITEINSAVYAWQKSQNHDDPLAKIYWLCRGWSYEYFDDFYSRVGVKFEKYYPESTVAETGLDAVLAHTPGVYEKSKESDAVIFAGEKYGLHTRVFVNSRGLPTYEAKDVGLSLTKWADYRFDKSVIITGNDILEYMKVVVKSISLFAPEPAARTEHITHGNVKLAGGVKMSSRKGNFVRAVDVLDLTEKLQEKESGEANSVVALAAVKFGFLRADIGPDVVFEPENSVSLTGFSGPYVQYAAVRVNKILRDNPAENAREISADYDYESEKNVLLKLLEFPEILRDATAELKPHKVADYVFELAKIMNKYYEKTPIATRNVSPEIREIRLDLLEKVARVFAQSLQILGIEIPEKM